MAPSKRGTGADGSSKRSQGKLPPDLFDLERIRDNDPSLLNVTLDYKTIGSPRKHLEALCYNVHVTKLTVVWDEELSPIDPKDYECFAYMLAYNQTIQEVKLVFRTKRKRTIVSNHWRPVMNALVKYGGYIRLTKMTLENQTRNVSDVDLLAMLLRRYPCIVSQELDVSFSTKTTNKAEESLKAIFACQLVSLTLRGEWYTPRQLAAAMEKEPTINKHSPIPNLSLHGMTSLDGATRLWTAIACNQALLCLTLSRTGDACFEFFLRNLHRLRHITTLQLHGLDWRFWKSIYRAVQAHGKIPCLDLHFSTWNECTETTPLASAVVLEGVQDLSIAASLPRSLTGETRTAEADRVVERLCQTLHSNVSSVQTLKICVEADMSLTGFHTMAQLWPMLPSLEVVDVRERSGRPLPMDCAYQVLQAVRACPRLHTIKTYATKRAANDPVWDQIAYYCERNRVNLDGLLQMQPPTSAVLWPSVLAKTRHSSVLFQILRGKPDLLAGAGTPD